MSAASDPTAVPPHVIYSYLDRRQYDRVLELVGSADPNAVLPGELQAIRGWAHLGRNDLVNARVAFFAALQQAPEELDFLRGLAITERYSGDLAAAENAILAALRRAPEWTPALCEYARQLCDGYQYDKAKRILAEAKRLAPENVAVAREIASVAFVDGDREAAKAVAALLRLAPDDRTGLSYQATLSAGRFRLGDAARSAAQAARANPGDERAVEQARALRLANHWTLWPLRPFQRLGYLGSWLMGMALIFGTMYFLPAAVFPFVLWGWLGLCAYSWLAPPLVKRLMKRGWL